MSFGIIVSCWLKYERSEKQVSYTGGGGGGGGGGGAVDNRGGPSGTLTHKLKIAGELCLGTQIFF